ncbi:hypothetical protein ACWDG1_09095 [Streptomyces sp. NPDC001177]
MAKDITGRGRITIFPLLHDWETGSRCVLAYTTADGGRTAILGIIPIDGNTFEPGDLFAMAGRHSPNRLGDWKGTPEQVRGCWLACTGYSSRLTKKPGTIDVEASWSLDMTQRVTLASAYYGHLHVMAGRFTLEDAELMEQARALVPVPAAV